MSRLSQLIGYAVKCYQCSSDDDKSNDNCGAYDHFNYRAMEPVDCMGEDAVAPGILPPPLHASQINR